MPVPLKYAVIERERRFLVSSKPEGIVKSRGIVDHYLVGTRLRLREVIAVDGTVTNKLGHKVRFTRGPEEVACTSMYLDPAEWEILRSLPAKTLRKTRHLVRRDGCTVAIDEFDDGTLIAEIDVDDRQCPGVPSWLDVIREVSTEERWTGAGLAQRLDG